MLWKGRNALVPASALLLTGAYLVLPASATDVSPGNVSVPEKSPRPSPREWREAQPETRLRIVGERARDCQGWIVREWLRVSCPNLPTAAVRLVGGQARDAYFHIEPSHPEKVGLPGGGEFVIAVRPGEARVIQFWSFGPGYDGPLTVSGSITFQESWLPDEAEPTLLLYDALHEPVRTATQDGK